MRNCLFCNAALSGFDHEEVCTGCFNEIDNEGIDVELEIKNYKEEFGGR